MDNPLNWGIVLVTSVLVTYRFYVFSKDGGVIEWKGGENSDVPDRDMFIMSAERPECSFPR